MQEITGTTRFMAILADPIRDVKTPQSINRLMAGRVQDAVMIPMHVESADLAAVLKVRAATRNFDGAVVTLPHKSAVAQLCDDLTAAARQVGAVNVIRRLPDGRLRGGILDGDSFVAGLRARGIEPLGERAYVAGAGSCKRDRIRPGRRRRARAA